MQRIRKGDDVVVIAGRDKGKRGSVLRVMPDGRVVVADVNMVKRHTVQYHAVQSADQQG
jgi:large subunit ribosomal protein L24